MTAICPRCGFDLARDEPMQVGDYRYDPRGGFVVRGKALRLAPQPLELAAALFRARGRTVDYDVLVERLGLSNRQALTVVARRVRTAFNAEQIWAPIVVVRGVGMAWGGAPFVGPGEPET